MTNKQRRQLAAEVDCTDQTVKRWIDGFRVHGPTAYALEAACAKLKIALPAREAESVVPG